MPPRLAEAGKMLSGENASAIQAALKSLATGITTLEGLLSKASGDQQAESARGLSEAMQAKLTEVDRSYSDLSDMVQDAAQDAWCSKDDDADYCYVYVCDLYPDTAVIRMEDRYFQVSWALVNDAITLGTPQEVVRSWSPVGPTPAEDMPPAAPAASGTESVIAESGASFPIQLRESVAVAFGPRIVQLTEKAVRSDGTALIKVIQPGWGSSGYYPSETLRRDGPTAFPAGTRMFANHPTPTEDAERPERDITDLWATLDEAAAWRDDGPAGAGLYATARVLSPFRERVDELAPHIGVSIRALGRATYGEADGRKGPIVERLVEGQSVDFVTQAGAGGQMVPLSESAVPGTSPKEDPMSEQALQEAQTKITSLESRLAEMRERELLREAGDQALAALRVSGLHELTVTRLRESLVTRAPLTAAGALDRATFATTISEAISAAQAEYAQISGSGRVAGMGGIAVAESDPAKLTESLVDSFTRLGISAEAAQIAAAGRP